MHFDPIGRLLPNKFFCALGALAVGAMVFGVVSLKQRSDKILPPIIFGIIFAVIIYLRISNMDEILYDNEKLVFIKDNPVEYNWTDLEKAEYSGHHIRLTFKTAASPCKINISLTCSGIGKFKKFISLNNFI